MNYRSVIVSIILLCSFYSLSNAQLLISNGIVYNIVADNEVEVYKVYNHPVHNIPDKILHAGLTWNVVGLADRSFSLCYPLEYVVLPSSLRYIGHKAFEDCKNLKEIHINATKPPITAPDFLDQIHNVPIISVPRNSYDSYFNNQLWGRFRKKPNP